MRTIIAVGQYMVKWLEIIKFVKEWVSRILRWMILMETVQMGIKSAWIDISDFVLVNFGQIPYLPQVSVLSKVKWG